MTRRTSIRNWQGREECYGKRTAKPVGEEALLVAEEAQGASEETDGYVRRALNRGWRVRMIEPDVEGVTENELGG